MKRRQFLKKSTKIAGGAVLLATTGTAAAFQWGHPLPSLGHLPTGERLKRILSSPQFRDGNFANQNFTPMIAPDSSYLSVSRQYLKKIPNREPGQPLPVVQPNYALAGDKPTVTWLGHSSYVVQAGGLNIVVDPVFHKASPVSWAGPAPYAGPAQFTEAQLPQRIDVLLITHDHYDHLDCQTIKALLPRIGHVVTSLGVGSHLEFWGVPANKITELDWWESTTLASGARFTATPARHFSGRSLKRNQTLWSSFVFDVAGYRLFLGGDSGYDTHFTEIGKKYGPFDLALLECGQYNPAWQFIHMMPEQTALAATDLGAKLLLPVHWGKFTLALHPWTDPITRVVAKADELKLPLATPSIGQTTSLDKLAFHPWWS